jgi:hypothetical protein
MNGDFSRDTSRSARLARYTRVLLQQGRPLLDADFNEQSAIDHDFLRTLIVDLMGRGWRPDAGQFVIRDAAAAKDGFRIAKGHFYVDGMLCDNPADSTFVKQLFVSEPGPPPDSFVAYIECWERHVGAVQRPELREVALGGADTASRAQIVWRVRAGTPDWADAQAKRVIAVLDKRINVSEKDEADALTGLKTTLMPLTQVFSKSIGVNPLPAGLDADTHRWFDAVESVPARLRARARRDASDNEACSISPEARYRGHENQLYRVEIHADSGATGGPTLKWSRENGSVMFAIRQGAIALEAGTPGRLLLTIPLETLGHDGRTGICVGDWVELTSDAFDLDALAPPLGQIKQIDRNRRTVVVEMVNDPTVNFANCTLLRRWDQNEHVNDRGTVAITEAEGADAAWTPLERGVQIQFQPGGVYRTGDHWLIPARAASGDLLWPQRDNVPVFAAPNGVERRRAVIGVATKAGAGWTFLDAGATR